MSDTKRLALCNLPIFRAAFRGASFDSATTNLWNLYRRATSAAMDRNRVSDEWMKELRTNALHRWLVEKLPLTLSHAPSELKDRIRFCFDLISLLYHLDVMKKQRDAVIASRVKALRDGRKRGKEFRADKKRTPVITGIKHLEDALEDGVVVLNRAKRSLLRQLLSEAKTELAAKRTKSEAHPALVYLSEILALQKANKHARKAAILELSAVGDRNANLSPSTADKYAGMSGRVNSPASRLKHAMDRSEWHLLDIIEQNR